MNMEQKRLIIIILLVFMYLRSMLQIHFSLFQSYGTETNSTEAVLWAINYFENLTSTLAILILVPVGVTRGRVITERECITACKYRHEHGSKSEHGKVVSAKRRGEEEDRTVSRPQ